MKCNIGSIPSRRSRMGGILRMSPLGDIPGGGGPPGCTCSVDKGNTFGSRSDVGRTPPPEWPLIMPCDARNCLIFSRSSCTLLFSCAQQRSTLNSRHPTGTTYPHPIWTLCTESEAFQTKADTRLAVSIRIWSFVAFLHKFETRAGNKN